VTAAAQPERTNQNGRILDPAPVLSSSTLFNKLQADATLVSINGADDRRQPVKNYAFGD